ncbi:MAG: TetR/AcrR family transcriptional regulator [Proteobacteria bacterium]|nr:TetR/AcrR family transcriptional regulator [Pseudomonadota bacterium]
MAASTDTTPRRAGRPRSPVPRETLISAAITAFANHGYAAASLDRIAEEAGIRKSSLLHRFGSKQALYLESLAAVLGNLGEMVATAATSDGSFVDRLDGLSSVITDYLSDEPRAARLLYREVMDLGPFFAGSGGDVYRQVLATAVAFVQAGSDSGVFDVGSASDTIISIVGVHLTYFATHELSEQVTGAPIFDEAGRARRKREVIVQIRRLCGVR